MKQWLLTTFFKKELEAIRRNFYTEVMRAATKDVEETMREDLDKQAEKIATQMVSSLLSNVDLTKIITVSNRGIIMIGGEDADDAMLNNLKAEAEFFSESELWKLLQETPKELAQRAMFVQGDSLDDMKKGRSILYTLSTQKNIIELLRSFVRK